MLCSPLESAVCGGCLLSTIGASSGCSLLLRRKGEGGLPDTQAGKHAEHMSARGEQENAHTGHYAVTRSEYLAGGGETTRDTVVVVAAVIFVAVRTRPPARLTTALLLVSVTVVDRAVSWPPPAERMRASDRMCVRLVRPAAHYLRVCSDNEQ